MTVSLERSTSGAADLGAGAFASARSVAAGGAASAGLEVSADAGPRETLSPPRVVLPSETEGLGVGLPITIERCSGFTVPRPLTDLLVKDPSVSAPA